MCDVENLYNAITKLESGKDLTYDEKLVVAETKVDLLEHIQGHSK